MILKEIDTNVNADSTVMALKHVFVWEVFF